jgi:hypothetical protein
MGLMGGSAPFYSIGQQIPKIDADQVIQTTGLLGSSKGEQWRSSPVSRRRAIVGSKGPLVPQMDHFARQEPKRNPSYGRKTQPAAFSSCPACWKFEQDAERMPEKVISSCRD